MMRSRVLIFLGLLACPAAPAPATSIDSNVRQVVVAKLSDALRNNYVFPDVGQKAAEKITTIRSGRVPTFSGVQTDGGKAMLALKGSREWIIDDRRNGGGSPESAAYFVSFLVAPNHPIEISDIVSRQLTLPA
jgi:hypothetical protein